MMLTVIIAMVNIRTGHCDFLQHLKPNSFLKGDVLNIHVGQLISRKSNYPMDFYKLAWCDSTAGDSYAEDSIGVTMRDKKITESPYQVSSVNFL